MKIQTGRNQCDLVIVQFGAHLQKSDSYALNSEQKKIEFHQPHLTQKSNYVQLRSSSRAKHGGAYFSAVFGRKFNPTTVLRPCQPLACYWRVGIVAVPTLFSTSAKHHGSRWCGWSDLSLLFTSIKTLRIDGFTSPNTRCWKRRNLLCIRISKMAKMTKTKQGENCWLLKRGWAVINSFESPIVCRGRRRQRRRRRRRERCRSSSPSSQSPSAATYTALPSSSLMWEIFQIKCTISDLFSTRWNF